MRKFRVSMALLLTITLLLSMFLGFALGEEENVFSPEEAIEMEAGTESVEDGTSEELLEETLPGDELSEPTLSEENATNFKLPDIEQLLGPSDITYVDRLVEAEEDLYTFVFLNEDGTRTKRLYSHPVKYIDENGSIHDITTDIKALENGAFQTEDNAILTTFAKHLTDGITLAHGDISIKMTPQLPTTTGSLATSPMQIGSLSEDFKTVSYPYMDKTTLEYELTYTGFKEDIVVSEYTGQTEYSFLLSTGGLYLHEEEGSYYLIDDEDTVRATIGDIIIFTADERNNTFGSMSAVTIKAGQEYLLTIHVDAEYLADEATAYPIRIDPTIEVNYDNDGSGAIQDVTINSNGGSSGTSGSLFVGLRESSGIARILMRFPGLDLSDVASASNITTAYVEIRDVMCESTAMAVSCYTFTGNAWEESTANWSNVSPNSYSTLLSSNTISYSNGTSQTTAHRYRFNVVAAVKGWKDGTLSQSKGIIFKPAASVESGSTYIHKTFASYNRASYKPSLTVTYNSNITLNYTSTSVQEGSTKTLTATTSPSGLSVTWTSSNTAIATVSSAGVVTGKKAGKVTITATATDSTGARHSTYCTVYVYIKTGVYYIQNNYSKLYLEAYNGQVNPQTNVQQNSKRSSTALISYRLAQQWRIKHLGNGYYSIRPMHKLNMGLEVTSNNADIFNIGTTDTLAGVPTIGKWTIEYATNGYVFKHNGSNSYALQAPNTSAEVGGNISAVTYSSMLLCCHWSFEEITSIEEKVLIYNTATGSYSTSAKKAIPVGTSHTLLSLELTAAVVSGSTISQSVDWESSDPSVATVNRSTGAVTALKPGETTITAKPSQSTETSSASYTLVVIPFASGTYYIHNLGNSEYYRYLQIDNADSPNYSTAGASMEQWTFNAGSQQRWILTSTGGGYYKIISEVSGLALTVENSDVRTANATVVQRSYSSALTQEWRISPTSSGAYCIVPRCADVYSTGFSLAVANSAGDGAVVQQRTYTSDTNYGDEWKVYKAGTDITLLGVRDTEHDHVTCFGATVSCLSDLNYNGVYSLYSDTVSKNTVLDLLEQSSVFISRSHGQGSDSSSCILLYNEMMYSDKDKLSTEDIYDYSTNTAHVDLSNLDLVMFVGCYTAYGGSSGKNIVNAAHAAGANCAIGFKKKVLCVAANTWTEKFCEGLANGLSVDAAKKHALDEATKAHFDEEYPLNLDSCYIIYN